jgi:hypothetical protein
LAGFLNCKYSPPTLVTIEYHSTDRVFTPAAFPPVEVAARALTAPTHPVRAGIFGNAVERARLYLARVPPAIAGEHGDVHTFCVCCRLVRGFALDDSDALSALSDWNQRCEPPWSEADLQDKLKRARK